MYTHRLACRLISLLVSTAHIFKTMSSYWELWCLFLFVISYTNIDNWESGLSLSTIYLIICSILVAYTMSLGLSHVIFLLFLPSPSFRFGLSVCSLFPPEIGLFFFFSHCFFSLAGMDSHALRTSVFNTFSLQIKTFIGERGKRD